MPPNSLSGKNILSALAAPRDFSGTITKKAGYKKSGGIFRHPAWV
jgi:hypothetical protein